MYVRGAFVPFLRAKQSAKKQSVRFIATAHGLITIYIKSIVSPSKALFKPRLTSKLYTSLHYCLYMCAIAATNLKQDCSIVKKYYVHNYNRTSIILKQGKKRVNTHTTAKNIVQHCGPLQGMRS